MTTDLIFVTIGVVMLTGLLLIAGSVSRDEHRLRARWEARFEHEARATRKYRRDRRAPLPQVRRQRQREGRGLSQLWGAALGMIADRRRLD